MFLCVRVVWQCQSKQPIRFLSWLLFLLPRMLQYRQAYVHTQCNERTTLLTDIILCVHHLLLTIVVMSCLAHWWWRNYGGSHRDAEENAETAAVGCNRSTSNTEWNTGLMNFTSPRMHPTRQSWLFASSDTPVIANIRCGDWLGSRLWDELM